MTLHKVDDLVDDLVDDFEVEDFLKEKEFRYEPKSKISGKKM